MKTKKNYLSKSHNVKHLKTDMLCYFIKVNKNIIFILCTYLKKSIIVKETDIIHSIHKEITKAKNNNDKPPAT